jgi:hypothetical protein
MLRIFIQHSGLSFGCPSLDGPLDLRATTFDTNGEMYQEVRVIFNLRQKIHDRLMSGLGD